LRWAFFLITYNLLLECRWKKIFFIQQEPFMLAVKRTDIVISQHGLLGIYSLDAPFVSTISGSQCPLAGYLVQENFTIHFVHKIKQRWASKACTYYTSVPRTASHRLQKLKMIRSGWEPCLPATLCVRILTRNKHKRKKSG
jgi:hypothetical protein